MGNIAIPYKKTFKNSQEFSVTVDKSLLWGHGMTMLVVNTYFPN